ncbi:MAG: hypothetical protein HRU22_12075 [Gammaproteobacteria bacterium]|nr:hypothetical protein [Gammaproteobacteria bacterium]
MLKKSILFVLVLLFASQTIAAAFDGHKIHQSTNQHRSLDQEHQAHPEPIISLSDIINDVQSPPDCHHCCHCHAPSSVYILTTLSSSLLNIGSSTLPSHVPSQRSILLTPEHRPPIIS